MGTSPRSNPNPTVPLAVLLIGIQILPIMSADSLSALSAFRNVKLERQKKRQPPLNSDPFKFHPVSASRARNLIIMATEESPLLGDQRQPADADSAQHALPNDDIYNRFSCQQKRVILAIASLTALLPSMFRISFWRLRGLLIVDRRSSTQCSLVVVSSHLYPKSPRTSTLHLPL